MGLQARTGQHRKTIRMNDPINPDHYRRHGIELIDLIETMPFSRANVIKYVARAGHKNPATEIEDLHKAAWYLDREIARLEGETR